jgi:hypothetical protein
MSYSVKIELVPHADPAKTVGIYTQDAAGLRQPVGWVHEKHPIATVSVPPGCILILTHGYESP